MYFQTNYPFDELQSPSLDLVADVFQGLYALLWSPTQFIQLTEASVLGHIISAPESEVPTVLACAQNSGVSSTLRSQICCTCTVSNFGKVSSLN